MLSDEAPSFRVGSADLRSKPAHDSYLQSPTGVQTVFSPSGVNITHKEPGEEGICETTPGVSSVNIVFVEPRSDGLPAYIVTG